MILPVRNATILKIAGGGTSEDYDEPAGADTAKWEGRRDAQLLEQALSDVEPGPGRPGGSGSGAALDELVRTRLIFDAALATVVPGDSVTFRHRGVVATREVLTVVTPEPLGTVHVTLVDA